MNPTPAVGGPRRDHTVALSNLCRTVFESLPRSDQRRWAEIYVRGLVSVPGRKSIRRIAEQVAGRSIEQCLQQFVNQSPWDWAPVRHVLTRATEAILPSSAWVVQEVEFPKDGQSSVGVGAQFVSGAKQTVNCQLGLTTWLAGEGGAVPVNWRLMLPAGWDTDLARRAKAHLPASERHRPCWEHILDSVDEMVESWKLTPRPVVSDRRHDRRLEPLLRGLEERHLAYAVRISDRTPVAVPTARGAQLRAGDLIRSAARGLTTTPPDPGPGVRRERRGSSLSVAQAFIPSDAAVHRTEPTRSRRRRVVARWPHGRAQPGQLWLTNMATAPMSELLGILNVAERAILESNGLRAHSGLDHFEGRSFRGWHHHVTLASVAHAHRVLPTHRRLLEPLRC